MDNFTLDIGIKQDSRNAVCTDGTCISKGADIHGSAEIIANDMETRPEWTPWLASVFVAPDFRNQGVGGNLVRHVMQQAYETGIEKLYLFAPP